MNDNIFESAQYVYNCLNDDISKKIFLARLMYSATGDMSVMSNIDQNFRNLSSDIELFAKKIKSDSRKVIYGAGANGRIIVNAFSLVKFEAFIDNYREDKIDNETGLAIYNIDEFKNKYRNDINDITIIISLSDKTIANDVKSALLQKLGICGDNILICATDWRNNSSQYFDLFTPREHESFVDCGCFDGGTCYRFVGWCGSLGFDNIYSFEPDKNSYKKCKNVLSALSKCELYPYGTSNKQGRVYFVSNGKENARIITKKEAEILNFNNVRMIDTVSLDEFLYDKKITFIKMDIEGAEYETLLGAEKIIREQHPRLAVSVYHRIDDFIKIPKWLLSIYPNYKLYFRHYSLMSDETVLYAE